MGIAVDVLGLHLREPDASGALFIYKKSVCPACINEVGPSANFRFVFLLYLFLPLHAKKRLLHMLAVSSKKM